jgi:hypothetical protein
VLEARACDRSCARVSDAQVQHAPHRSTRSPAVWARHCTSPRRPSCLIPHGLPYHPALLRVPVLDTQVCNKKAVQLARCWQCLFGPSRIVRRTDAEVRQARVRQARRSQVQRTHLTRRRRGSALMRSATNYGESSRNRCWTAARYEDRASVGQGLFGCETGTQLPSQ